MDYSIFYRRSINTERISEELPRFDLLISAYNPTERIQKAFSEVRAKRKVWLIHPEYQFTGIDLPQNQECIQPEGIDEVAQIDSILQKIDDIRGISVCVDITGFMRHVLAFFVAKLQNLGVKKVEFLYSEPMFYKKQEETIFSTTTSGTVRPVRGMAGSKNSNGLDFLILGVGYDHRLISEVTNNKDSSTVHPVFGFPSLSPDMYQQSAIRSAESGEVALENSWLTNRHFAPANDPFSTAQVVSEIVDEIEVNDHLSNIYLSPLSTKVQALGFALYWCLEGKSRGAVSFLMPECLTYSRETSEGLKRLWSYTVEFI